jgi:multiple sugar transport system substrate-binding protein
MNHQKKFKLIVLFLIFAFLFTSGFGCKLVDFRTRKAMKPKKLTFWGVFDDSDVYAPLIAKYKKIHPYISITYKKFRYDEYEKEFINALAEDRGPDIFMIHNTWVRKYSSKIEPMPEVYKMVYPEVRGKLKKEVIPKLKTVKSITLKQLESKFIDAVYDDVVVPDKKGKPRVWGLPLAVDTLAMYYNKDLFNNAGIIEPPQYWDRDFQKMVAKLTKQDINGQIVQSGVAMGGSTNIERYSDILSVLMMQNGAIMEDEHGKILFHTIPPYYQEQKYNPGASALEFYTDFANPLKEVYCWNKKLDNSLDLFARGKVAMMFGYSYHYPRIKALNPKLNFGIAKLPQIKQSSQQVNFANYWLLTVSKKSKYTDEAWDFIQFLATQEDNVKAYLQAVQQPPALRGLIEDYTEDQKLGPFAEQLLTAKSWYRGQDPIAAEEIIAEMIDSAAAGQDDIQNIINLAARRIQQTIKTK